MTKTPSTTVDAAASGPVRRAHRPLRIVPVEKWVANTRLLLEEERREEIGAVQAELATLKDLENPNVLVHMRLSSRSTGLFGRTLLVFAHPNTGHGPPRPHQFTVGDLVQLRIATTSGGGGGGASDPFPTGIVARIEESAISIALEDAAAADERLDEDRLRGQSVTIDRLVNNATFAKITTALDQLARHDHGEAQRVVDIVFNGASPQWNDPPPAISPFNPGLNAPQLAAIRFALASKDLALIHGPPGTGKTTTVVELIRQAVSPAFRMKVLVCAPSNIAVDNVLEKLATADPTLRLTRIGHPARLLPQILRHCLDARIARAEGTEIVGDIRKEMVQMEKTLAKTRDKGTRFQLRRELKANRKEIRQREQRVVVELLKHSDVVFATNVGAASKLLRDLTFDMVVIDEAAQALEASCWIPMLKAKRCVLAGDHLQLPPTIKSKKAAANGLEITLFDRITRFETTRDVVKMLTIQYRMHEDISNWSSRAMYDGNLESFDGVARRKLHELPHVRIRHDDDLLNATLLLLDTVGCELEEDTSDPTEPDAKRTESSLLKLSKSNEGEATIVEKHVRALLDAGLRPHEIAIITPYNKQVQLLKLRLLDTFPTLEIRSVDGFQGCEKEAVVMSLVRSNPAHEVGFLADERRMNVAITRAKRHVAVVCDTDTISSNAFLKKLVQHFENIGEYRSAQEYLDEDHAHGTADAQTIATVVAEAATAAVALKTKETRATRSSASTSAVAQTPERPKRSKPQQKPKSTPAVKDPSPKEENSSSSRQDSSAQASTASTDKIDEHVESDVDVEDGKGSYQSAFAQALALDDSDDAASSESDEDVAPEAPDGVAQEDTSSANALLKELHLSRVARGAQPPPPPSLQASASTSKSKKAKKKKSKKKSSSSGAGATVGIDEMHEDEDELEFLTRQAEQSNRCNFAASTRCKKTVTILGTICKFCKLKFCYDHAQPEMHGCGDAVRQFARAEFRATSSATPDRKKLTADKRKLLHKKLEDKVSEQTATRTTKAKPKKK